MTLELHEPTGATPLTPDELLGLKAKHIATRGELNELEAGDTRLATGVICHGAEVIGDVWSPDPDDDRPRYVITASVMAISA